MADTFNVVFTEQAIEQLKQFVRSDRNVILDAVKVQLPLMNTIAIDLTQKPITLTELLNAARQGNVILRDLSGDQFIISHADDLAMEVDLLRQNHAFLAFLDAGKKAEKTFSLDEAEAMLR